MKKRHVAMEWRVFAPSQLQVWRDANQDGISQAGELSGLDALGITRIGLNGSSTGPQAGQTINNNRVALSTTFTRNGVTRTVGAIDLEANGFFSAIPPEVVDAVVARRVLQVLA